ncbi:MAG TPA: hypothetical protein VMI75_18975 [Polyangiaceae bacterium]|nr:hypothetical protein [Polyangiaceae bacterium]
MRARALLFAMALAASISAPASLGAQQSAPQQPAHPAALPPRQANYAWDQDLLRASFSYRDVMSDPSLLKKMASGLPMVIAMRAYLFQQGQDNPVALAPRVCRVAYDLWDEVYRIHVSEHERERDQAAVLDGVLRICTEARDLPIVRRGALTPGEPYFLGVVVDVNPVSPDMIEQIRRWIARPTGSTGIGPTDALFGGFVQLFVRQIATSDKTITFRTQDIVP